MNGTKKRPELMAPAGGWEQMTAAVRAGADAVYLGTGGFNARRTAENFGGGALERAVAYCHGRGVRVYVTLNTLVTDPEIPVLVREMEQIAAAGADAVILQDMAAARLLRRFCPKMPLHASTQMSIHNAAGARELARLGFSRVVIARELTESELRMVADSGLEVEAFVHGALCMSVSGQCYLSSMLGGRSGNRGLCAQPCRLDFTAQGRHNVLSLKDLSLVQQIERLVRCGVTALKIEGRLKRPEYVAAAVTACRRALDGESPDMQRLRAVFSRSGFTDGYFFGRRDLSMFGVRTKEDVAASARELGRWQAAYREETPRVPVDMGLRLRPGEAAFLRVSDGIRTVSVSGPPPEIARGRATDRELALRGLSKTGGTPFFLREAQIDLEGKPILPVSAINAMRKQALEQLLALREAPTARPFNADADFLRMPPSCPAEKTELWLRFEGARQMPPEAAQAADRLILPVEELPGAARGTDPEKIVAELPLMVYPGDEDAFVKKLSALRAQGFAHASAGNLGTIRLAREAGFQVHGDYALNILNAQALAEYREIGLCSAVLSFEIGMKQAVQVAGRVLLPVGLLVYGYLPLMLLRNCPARGAKGCPEKGSCRISDRKKMDFALTCREKKYARLHNPVPLYLGDRREKLRGFSHQVLYFTTESPTRCARVLQLWQEGAPLDIPRTGGLYFRELL